MTSDTTLLSINDVCNILKISRRKFERLRRSEVKVTKHNGEEIYSFPSPTIIINRSPRWSVTCLNNWIN